MKRTLLFSIVLLVTFVIISSFSLAQEGSSNDKKWSRVRIDNQGTNNTNADYKYVPCPPLFKTYNLGSIDAFVKPNYRVFPSASTTQSELSIDIHPLNASIMFGSANSTQWPLGNLYGTGIYWTTNAGTNWSGFDNPPFGSNSGDPASAIGTNGYFYEGYITSAGGMGVATSTNSGANWTASVASSLTGDDKNHLMVDKKVGSPYENRLYNVWTDFNTGTANENDAVFKYSTNYGATWGPLTNLSGSLNAGSHSQGVNVQTGPNGEVYVTFAIYDGWPSGEDAIGFSKSTDGGVTFTNSRIYGALTPSDNFNFGIRGYLKPTSIRVASFPSMSVDRSGGANNGTIYIVWPQINVAPAGSDPDVVLIKSTNGGATWSSPVRVNDDPLNNGKEQYYPWCAVDQNTGRLNIVYYDNRNTNSDSTGVFLGTSIDGGVTFENFEISDANFKPKPINGLAGGYQGDYIGIAAAGNKTYPFWMDDRTGNYQAWITEVTFGPGINHTPLTDTENLTGPYVVNAIITSQNPLVPSQIKMFWGKGVGVISDSVVMTNTGGSNYTASIAGDGLSHIYNYYIKAVDNQGFVGTSPGGAPSVYHTFEAATDVVLPVITHTPLNNQAKVRWPVELFASATDNFGIQSVTCEFKINVAAATTF
jgi:hypothetical protein